jgi:hypothetical protein
MPRDTSKYVYVEVALPLHNESIQAMLAASERDSIPLRVLIKQAVISFYNEEAPSESHAPRPKAKRTTNKPKTKKKTLDSIPEAAISSAAAFLDDEGF